jgi:hypothetical protein
MNRDDLMTMLAELDAKTLKVDVEGLVCVGEDNWYAEVVEDAILQMEEDLKELRAVIAWAKLAPKRAAGDPSNTGTTADANGVPY